MDGRSFREIFEWKGVSLWWMSESFFRTAPEAPACVRLVETWLRILEAEAPDEVEAGGLTARESVLLERAATSRGVLFQGKARVPSGRARLFRSWLRSWRSERRPRSRLHASPKSAFMLVGEDRELDAVINGYADDDLLRVSLRGLVEGDAPAARREVARARRRFRRSFAELRRSPGVHEAFSHRGVSFYDLGEIDLADLLFIALPRAVHLFEEMTALLGATAPSAVALLVPSRDERRTLLAACAAADVPGVVLRTGDGDEPERADGGPQAQLVLAWNGSASPEDVREALREATRIKARRLTGNSDSLPLRGEG